MPKIGVVRNGIFDHTADVIIYTSEPTLTPRSLRLYTGTTTVSGLISDPTLATVDTDYTDLAFSGVTASLSGGTLIPSVSNGVGTDLNQQRYSCHTLSALSDSTSDTFDFADLGPGLFGNGSTELTYKSLVRSDREVLPSVSAGNLWVPSLPTSTSIFFGASTSLRTGIPWGSVAFSYAEFFQFTAREDVFRTIISTNKQTFWAELVTNYQELPSADDYLIVATWRRKSISNLENLAYVQVGNRYIMEAVQGASSGTKSDIYFTDRYAIGDHDVNALSTTSGGSLSGGSRDNLTYVDHYWILEVEAIKYLVETTNVPSDSNTNDDADTTTGLTRAEGRPSIVNQYLGGFYAFPTYSRTDTVNQVSDPINTIKPEIK